MKLVKALQKIIFFGFASCAVSAALANDNSRHISYTDVGKGQPLVLIHAFPIDQDLWEPQRNGLKGHFRVITLDLRGFGQSAPTNGKAVTMTAYADEVKGLLNELHIQQAIIGGESMGGYVALAFLQKYPEAVNGLILSDTQSIADSAETKAKREATAQDILKNGSSKLIAGFMPKALSPDAPKEQVSFLEEILAKQKAPAVASALRGMALRNDTSNLLAQSSLPILIMTGNEDTLILPQQSSNMHALAKNSRLVTITNAAHLSSLEQPEQWNEAVIDMFYK